MSEHLRVNYCALYGPYRCLVAASIDILQGEQIGLCATNNHGSEEEAGKIDAKHAKPLCDVLSNNFLFATTRAYLQALQWRDCLVQLHSC